MAPYFTTCKFYSLLFALLVLLLLLLVVMEEEPSGQISCCLYPNPTSTHLVHFQSRKVLVVSNNVNGEKLVVEELRTVPSGPDPLHHNGGNPKKPTTP